MVLLEASPANDNKIVFAKARAEARIRSLWVLAETDAPQALRDARNYVTLIKSWPTDGLANRQQLVDMKRLKAEYLSRVTLLIQYLEG
jgi:hypothetical protein